MLASRNWSSLPSLVLPGGELGNQKDTKQLKVLLEEKGCQSPGAVQGTLVRYCLEKQDRGTCSEEESKGPGPFQSQGIVNVREKLCVSLVYCFFRCVFSELLMF